MAVVEVNDIKVAKDGEWRSLRNQKIAKDGEWHKFGTGSGVAWNNNWYVLNEKDISLILLNVKPKKYTFGYDETAIKFFAISNIIETCTVAWKPGHQMDGALLLYDIPNNRFTIECTINTSNFIRSGIVVVTDKIGIVEVVVEQTINSSIVDTITVKIVSNFLSSAISVDNNGISVIMSAGGSQTFDFVFGSTVTISRFSGLERINYISYGTVVNSTTAQFTVLLDTPSIITVGSILDPIDPNLPIIEIQV